MSYETDNSVVGVFIDKLTAVLEKGNQGPSNIRRIDSGRETERNRGRRDERKNWRSSS